MSKNHGAMEFLRGSHVETVCALSQADFAAKRLWNDELDGKLMQFACNARVQGGRKEFHVYAAAVRLCKRQH